MSEDSLTKSGDGEQLPPFQREMRPFMALQLCIGDKWATAWEYRLPLEQNKGKEMVMLEEVAKDLVLNALDELGVFYETHT